MPETITENGDVEQNISEGDLYSESSIMFFRDKSTRIDFVIAFEATGDKETRRIRCNFLTKISAEGIDIELESTDGEKVENLEEVLELDDKKTYFAKLHAQKKLMDKVAAILQFKKPLRTESSKMEGRPQAVQGPTCFGNLKTEGRIFSKLPCPYVAPFSTDRITMFDSPENEDFYTPAERSAAVSYLLARTHSPSMKEHFDYLIKHCDIKDGNDDTNNMLETVKAMDLEVQTSARPEDFDQIVQGTSNVGIDWYIKESIFTAAFPLHEPMSSTQGKNVGHKLLQEWANLKRFYKYQPLNYVRLYFGESVALYFAWLGLYTYWLIPVGILGLLTFCLASWNFEKSPIITDICKNGTNFLMCPQCNAHCSFWTLDDACVSARLTHFVDQPFTLIFSIFMALWATLFMEAWKRYQNRLSYDWNVYDFEPVDEPPRPEFLNVLRSRHFETKENELTKIVEPVIPFWRFKIPILITTYSVVFLGIILTLAALTGVILYRVVIKLIFLAHPNHVLNSYSNVLVTVTSSCLNLVCIFILEKIYDKIAKWLTDLEIHRTQSEYDNSITLKLYMLQFVNLYSSIFYIAFFQGGLATVPGKDTNVQFPGCTSGNCLFELFIQLAIIMIGKQAINMVTENVIPRIKYYVRLFTHIYRMPITKKDDSSEVEETESMATINYINHNYNLEDNGPRPLFAEYLEIILQYGFITMFVPAFQLAPLFALLNNILELRTDAHKFLTNFRRPVTQREKSIGIWFTIMEFVSSLAIRTNACLIAFTSSFINHLVYRYQYSPTGTFEGYVNFSLSYMDVSRFNASMLAGHENDEYCRYFGYRSDPTSAEPYTLTKVYWHILAVKFIFIFVFELLILAITSTLAYVIPDVPERMIVASRLEKKAINEFLLKTNVKNKMSSPKNVDTQ